MGPKHKRFQHRFDEKLKAVVEKTPRISHEQLCEIFDEDLTGKFSPFTSYEVRYPFVSKSISDSKQRLRVYGKYLEISQKDQAVRVEDLTEDDVLYISTWRRKHVMSELLNQVVFNLDHGLDDKAAVLANQIKASGVGLPKEIEDQFRKTEMIVEVLQPVVV